MSNYNYALAAAKAATPMPNPVILDFGCGTAKLVGMARAAGLDAWGSDTYDCNEGGWEAIEPAVRPYVAHTDGERLPFPDATFDVVISNMVFEHIPWGRLRGALREIRRVLKPGGALIATFPTRETWFEGHVRLYFPHYLGRWPRMQLAYLAACHALGLGRARGSAEATGQWARAKQSHFGSVIFLHQARSVSRLMSHALGGQVENLAADYMRFRLKTWLPACLDPALRLVCAKRAGCVVLVRRAASQVA